MQINLFVSTLWPSIYSIQFKCKIFFLLMIFFYGSPLDIRLWYMELSEWPDKTLILKNFNYHIGLYVRFRRYLSEKIFIYFITVNDSLKLRDSVHYWTNSSTINCWTNDHCYWFFKLLIHCYIFFFSGAKYSFPRFNNSLFLRHIEATNIYQFSSWEALLCVWCTWIDED